MDIGLFQWIGAMLAGAFLLFLIIKIVNYRSVVPTNSVHIVQSSSRRTSYGGGPANHNTYYAWPSWLPVIGVRITVLPVNVFTLNLNNYAAYDNDRVPFELDLAAFFRISDSNMAAERVSNFSELQGQLDVIVKGAARKILANSPIDEILGNRSIFGDKFTEEVTGQLTEWGVAPVKNIELMDIRDAEDSKVIANIMAKKKSLIESQSRIEVAVNLQKAQEAEIEANKVVGIRQQEADEAVGIRKAQKDQQIGINNQKAEQAIKDEEAKTAEKQVAVQTVMEVGKANIAKNVQTVAAEQSRDVAKITADGTKARTVTEAEGALEARKLNAQGIEAEGAAQGAAETAKLMAPVTTQIALADKIASSEGYQNYLVRVREIEAGQAVGVEQAKALERADIKVIANAGTPSGGIDSVRELFSAKGGTQLGAMLEAIRNTDAGKKILDGLNGGKPG